MLIKNTIVNKVYLVSLLLLIGCDNDVAVAYSNSKISDIMILAILLLSVVFIALIYVFIRIIIKDEHDG